MKNIKHILTRQIIGATIAAAALITPAIVSAQEAPAYADTGANQQIQGTVSSIDGTWNITVADANGYSDNVALHQGTIINPTGLTLEPGMNVTVDGYADGPSFDALEIDTPYQYQGPAPVAVYYGPGNWYPGYASGWGPSFTLGFNFGTRSFVQRSFNYGGQVRRPMTPPAGWQNQPHGYIGNAGFARESQRSYARPAVNYGAPRTAYAQQPQARNFAPQQQARSFAAPQQQARSFAPQQQARSFAPQQQARSFAAPAQRSAAPAQRSAAYAPRGGQGGGDHHRG